MDVIIYGLQGHSGGLRVSLDDLELDELEEGREFIFGGRIYEIRSITETAGGTLLNVVLALDPG